jgi:hypothetical protein
MYRCDSLSQDKILEMSDGELFELSKKRRDSADLDTKILIDIVKNKNVSIKTLIELLEHDTCNNSVLDEIMKTPIVNSMFWLEVLNLYENPTQEIIDFIWMDRISRQNEEYSQRERSEEDLVYVEYSGSKRFKIKELKNKRKEYLLKMAMLPSFREEEAERIRLYKIDLENIDFFWLKFQRIDEKFRKYIYNQIGIKMHYARLRKGFEVEYLNKLNLPFDILEMESGYFADVDFEDFKKLLNVLEFSIYPHLGYFRWNKLSMPLKVEIIMIKRQEDGLPFIDHVDLMDEIKIEDVWKENASEYEEYIMDRVLRGILSAENIKKYGTRD